MDAVNLLLEHGANPLVRDDTGLNVYDAMAKMDHAELFGLFVDEAMEHDSRRNRTATGHFGLIHHSACGGLTGTARCMEMILERAAK